MAHTSRACRRLHQRLTWWLRQEIKSKDQKVRDLDSHNLELQRTIDDLVATEERNAEKQQAAIEAALRAAKADERDAEP